jgi:hypothetical protein
VVCIGMEKRKGREFCDISIPCISLQLIIHSHRCTQIVKALSLTLQSPLLHPPSCQHSHSPHLQRLSLVIKMSVSVVGITDAGD